MKDRIVEILANLPDETVTQILMATSRSFEEMLSLNECLKGLDFEGRDFFSVGIYSHDASAGLAYLCAARLGGAGDSNRVALGILTRETVELVQTGWWLADKAVQERKERLYHAESVQGCVRTLEASLYDSAKRGDTTDKVKALSYFKNKSQPTDNLLGDHILSGFTAVCVVAVICFAGLFASRLSCNDNNSAFCSDIRSATYNVTNYLSNPKN